MPASILLLNSWNLNLLIFFLFQSLSFAIRAPSTTDYIKKQLGNTIQKKRQKQQQQQNQNDLSSTSNVKSPAKATPSAKQVPQQSAQQAQMPLIDPRSQSNYHRQP
jgi:hypothetical protein